MLSLFLLLLHLTESYQLECPNPVDVIFALDATVDFYQFEQMKHFLIDSLNEFNLDGNVTRVAVFSYATEVIASRNLSAYQSKEAISQFVNRLHIENDAPNISSAFIAVRNNFSKISERRDMVPTVLVLLSGGGVNDFDAALFESTALRETHVSIVIATMNNSVTFAGFYALASYPFKRNFYNLNSNSVQTELITKICNRNISICQDYCRGRGECTSDVCHCLPGFSGKFCNYNGCLQPVNVFFALTAASSIDAGTFSLQLDLVQSVLLNLNLMKSKIGMAIYHNNTLDVKFDFRKYEAFSTDGDWFQRRMLDTTSSIFRMGYTNLTYVLKAVRQSSFASRENNVLVLFVSGPSADILASAREAALARNGPGVIQILVVTIGNLFSRDEVNAIAITPGVNIIHGVNILSLSFRPNMTTELVDSICNTKNECFPNPCLNSGTCIDFINGYRCFCPSNRAGLNCEYEGNEYMDLILGFDTSGSINNREFEDLLRFAVRLINQLDLSPSKTRVAGVKWNRKGYDLFHLDTFTSKQDIGWEVSQITYEPFEEGTNTSDALRIIKDTLLNPGQNGERQLARNIVLLFTDGNSNIDDEETIPMAIELKSSRNTQIITFGIGDFVNHNELASLCSIPPNLNKDYFIIPSIDSINNTFDVLFQMLISVDSCNIETCQNGGFCELRQRPTCICSGPFGGKTCEKYCGQSIDLVFLLDISKSEDYDTVNRSIVLARQIASFFPLETTKFSVVTFGSNTRVDFPLKNVRNFQDLMDSFAFKISTGFHFLRNAIAFLWKNLSTEGPQIYSTTNGGRRSSPNVAIIISGSYSTFEYQETIKEAQMIRDTRTIMYSVIVGNSPIGDLYLSIVGNSSKFFTLNYAEDLDHKAEEIATSICTDNYI